MKWLKSRSEKANRYLSKRLERGGGCGAVDCSAGREADKEEASAEECSASGTGRAALVPPEEAEETMLEYAEYFDEKAAVAMKSAEYFGGLKRETAELYQLHDAAACRYVRDLLYTRVSESRIANGEEPLDLEEPLNVLSDIPW